MMRSKMIRKKLKVVYKLNAYVSVFNEKFFVVPKMASKADMDKEIIQATEDEFGAKDYRNILTLKDDFSSRPLYVVSNKINKNLFYSIFIIFAFLEGTQWSHFLGILFPSLQTCSRFSHCHIRSIF